MPISEFKEYLLGDVIFEQKERAGENRDELTVYGVDRKVGITSESKYQSNNIHKYKILRKGMFAYNPMRLNIGSIGYCHSELREGLVSPDYVVFGCNEENLDSAYLNYFIKSDFWTTWVESAGVGSVRVRIYFREIINMPIKLPSIEYQKKTVSILKSFDKKIELNRQTNQTLEQIAQALFKSWFVDFEPVKAKIKAKQNSQNPELAAQCAISGKTEQQLKGLDEATLQQLKTTAALFPDALVESELGEIPEGWDIKPLSEIIKMVGGGTPKRSEELYWKGDLPWFSVKDAPSPCDIFVIDTIEKISELGLQKSSTKLLPVGTTIITARGTVGKLALVGTTMCMNQSCYGILGAEGIGPYFNYFNLREAISTLQRNTHGAVFDTITTKTFESYSMAICIGKLTKEYEQVVTPLLERIKMNCREVTALGELRDSLLPKLLSGELGLAP